jgi:hypothetical protein
MGLGFSGFSDNLESFQKNDEPVPEYFWIDKNVDSG